MANPQLTSLPTSALPGHEMLGRGLHISEAPLEEMEKTPLHHGTPRNELPTTLICAGHTLGAWGLMEMYLAWCVCVILPMVYMPKAGN